MLARSRIAGRRRSFRVPDPRLKQGRRLAGTCEAATPTTSPGAARYQQGAWAPRLAKGKDALYKSALGGLTGPKGTQMPPRGGNDKLTDDEVRRRWIT